MPPSPLWLAQKCQCLDVRHINTLGFFFSSPSSFPSVTHFQHMAALHYVKGNLRTSAADGKDTTNPKHLLYSSPDLIFKCGTFMFLIRLVPRLALASRDRDT